MNVTLPTCGVSWVRIRRTRSTAASSAFVFRNTSTRTLSRTSLAAPVVAWTIGMKTPSTSIVTSTDAIAANDGTALRRSERLASRRKNVTRIGAPPLEASGVVVVGVAEHVGELLRRLLALGVEPAGLVADDDPAL